MNVDAREPCEELEDGEAAAVKNGEFPSGLGLFKSIPSTDAR
jgi:hypothetical protein